MKKSKFSFPKCESKFREQNGRREDENKKMSHAIFLNPWEHSHVTHFDQNCCCCCCCCYCCCCCCCSPYIIIFLRRHYSSENGRKQLRKNDCFFLMIFKNRKKLFFINVSFSHYSALYNSNNTPLVTICTTILVI